ncbi:MAG: ABC transporter substrate-binding protein, partial [Treponema sp.]|nr:ABC transporter substrate-binding protein [Treponema sp.]
NPQYPGLLNFDNEILQNNMYTSAVGTHIYAIPLMQALGGAVNGYMIRKDLREKYGLPPIQSYDDLEKFYDMVLKNEPGMVPMAANSAGGPWQDTPTYPDQQSNPDSRYWQVPVGSGMFGIAELAPDRKTVSNFYMVGDPRLVQGKWFNQDIFLKARDWYVKGYVDKDIQSKTPADMQNAFTSGRAASLREGTPNYTVRKNALLKAVPGAQVEFWVYTSDKIRNMEPHAMKTNFLAANYQCIPVTSKYVDRTMNFYNWLFLTQDNHDLFEYGIEGTHWQAQGADKYTVPAGAAPYTFNGYKLTWNSKYIRYPADLEPDIFNYMKYTQDINSFYVEAFAGFTPNTEPYRTEMARVLPVQQEAQNTSITGVNADPKAALDGYYAKMVDLGLPKIYDEMIKQLNAFLAAKK